MSSTVPPVMATDSSAALPALSRIARATVRVLLPPPARLSVEPSGVPRVPAASVPPPVLLLMVAPLL